MEAKLKEIVERHLPYEIDMLFGTFGKLDEGISDTYLRNAAIESFCIHARNLIEFLEGTGKVKAKSVTNDYKAFTGGKIDKALKDKIQEQIAHLGFGRTIDPNELINRDDRLALARAIAAELLVFKKHLRPQHSATWEIKITEDTVAFRAARPPKKG